LSLKYEIDGDCERKRERTEGEDDIESEIPSYDDESW
jgi:hypothetical protein